MLISNVENSVSDFFPFFFYFFVLSHLCFLPSPLAACCCVASRGKRLDRTPGLFSNRQNSEYLKSIGLNYFETEDKCFFEYMPNLFYQCIFIVQKSGLHSATQELILAHCPALSPTSADFQGAGYTVVEY